MSGYNLVHIVTGGEFATPLVASQVFDHAQVQAETGGADAPAKVGIFIIEPMRTVLGGRHRATINSLRKRCPKVNIHLIGGVGRLNAWPAAPYAARLRQRKYGNLPVVYHCRGESAFTWGMKLRSLSRSDAAVLDVRGIWPLELLYSRGIRDCHDADGKNREDYLAAMKQLRQAVAEADAVTTVSRKLKEWLVKEVGASPDTTVVPCCVKSVIDDSCRQPARSRWGIKDGLILLYSGTTAPYQHLEDLVIPFVRAGLSVSEKLKAVFLTPDIEKMRGLVNAGGLDQSRIVVESLPQSNVAKALAGGDIGLLLRVPTTVNVVSQPTKVGEYLAAGLPIAVERGTGGVPAAFDDRGAGITVDTVRKSQAEVSAEARRVINWVYQNGANARVAARKLASAEFTWAGVLPRVREMYARALKNRVARKSAA